MEQAISWHMIQRESQSTIVPMKRWGHQMVAIQDQIILFGGFSDSSYLKDLWSYNIHTNTWRQVPTSGEIPEQKSNFSMHFDSVSNQLIIFGGGGSNKKRFNKVSILDWESKVWQQFHPLRDDESPWDRTYQSSEFKYPFLITFGGEGIANLDFDDLWTFNIETKQWVRLTPKQNLIQEFNSEDFKSRIEGRRFHATSLIENTFYVISGCKTNYHCIPDIYSIDIGYLFKSQDSNQQNSQWKKHKLNKQSKKLIERWGHSAQTYNGKIYIFGGRNKEDFNDVLQFDPEKDTVKRIQTNQSLGQAPKCRRRHSSCLIGSSMIIFGGFNMQYFNDLQYVSLFDIRSQLQEKKIAIEEELQIIELEESMMGHFLSEINQEKTVFNVELIVTNESQNKTVIVKSISEKLQANSPYLKNLLKYDNSKSSNPERASIQIQLSSEISFDTFRLFNAFLMKGILILPKGYELRQVCELIICADYFQNISLMKICEKLLSVRIINSEKDLDDIFNTACHWHMHSLLDICTEKKIRIKDYFNSRSKLVYLNRKAHSLKERCIQKMLSQVQFDEIQKGQKKRSKETKLRFDRNIKSVNLVKKTSLKQAKPSQGSSFMSRMFIEPLSKIYSKGEKQVKSESDTKKQNKFKSDSNIVHSSSEGPKTSSASSIVMRRG